VARVVRLVRLTPDFLARRASCNVLVPSSATTALGKTIAELMEAETLPEPGDSTIFLEDAARAISVETHVRRVRGHNLWKPKT
jgi:hypothetical protein